MIGQIMSSISGAVSSFFGSGDQTQDEAINSMVPGQLMASEETDEALVAEINVQHREWSEARKPYEQAWWTNLAFYMGFQYHVWNEAERLLRQPNAPTYRARLVVNRIMPVIKTFMGKLLRGDPRWQTMPAQPNDRAFSDARVCNKLLKALYRTLHGRAIFQEFMAWTSICGHGFVKTGWDPTLGKPVDLLPGMMPVYEGDIHLQPMGPFNILVPPEQMFLWRPSKLMECRIYPLNWVKAVYGKAAAGLQPDEDLSSISNYEARLSMLVSPTVSGGTPARAKMKGCVYLKERWEDPQTLHESVRAQYPRGRVVTVCQDKLLLRDGMPWRDGKHPYTDARAEIVPGRYWGTSLVDQLIPIQKSYNRGRSMFVEARNLAGNPVLDVEKDHGITKLTAEPGTIAERRRGIQAPAWRQPPAVPQHLAEDVKDTIGDFNNVAQLHEVSNGQLPAANVTGPAISMLQDADDTPLGPFAGRLADAYSEIGTKIISRAQQFYREPRMLTITGENQETEVLMFLGDKVPTEMRAECMVDSVLPETRASKLARVDEALNRNVLVPGRDQAALLELLEFGNVDKLYELVDLHRMKQQRELQAMQRGEPVQVASFDDDLVHINALDRWRVTVEYEQADPAIKAAVDAHAAQHAQNLMIKQQAMAGMGPPAPAAPSPAPPAGGAPAA